MAVAGSIRRSADAAEDAALAAELLASEKDREEQAIVVDAIRNQLAPIADTLQVAPEPSVMTLRFVQHLATEISGTLPEARGLLSVAGLLHPTPAVGGQPRDVALALVDEHEGFDRGWYAGPIGWLGADDDGELCVALRCGIVDHTRATLFAGCGIVADSDADAEWEESRLSSGPSCRRWASRATSRDDASVLRAFVAELAAAGVRDAVVCPGSRSTPLALALRASAGIRVRVLLDERAAGFFALGMARTSRRPVAILVTSGTAAMELAPAVVEASHGRVPLVVLTADRPPELRDRGAPQTIDQDHLYGRFTRWFSELPLPTVTRRPRPTSAPWPDARSRPRSPARRGRCTSTCRSASRCCPTVPSTTARRSTAGRRGRPWPAGARRGGARRAGGSAGGGRARAHRGGPRR